jgi:hypothetical protein
VPGRDERSTLQTPAKPGDRRFVSAAAFCGRALSNASLQGFSQTSGSTYVRFYLDVTETDIPACTLGSLYAATGAVWD